jgi:hypothetical protein
MGLPRKWLWGAMRTIDELILGNMTGGMGTQQESQQSFRQRDSTVGSYG